MYVQSTFSNKPSFIKNWMLGLLFAKRGQGLNLEVVSLFAIETVPGMSLINCNVFVRSVVNHSSHLSSSVDRSTINLNSK
jgi:hypothetical protein